MNPEHTGAGSTGCKKSALKTPDQKAILFRLTEKYRALKTIAVEFQRMYKGFQERPFFDFRSRNLGPEHRRILEMMILFVFINSILFKLSATGGRQ